MYQTESFTSAPESPVSGGVVMVQVPCAHLSSPPLSASLRVAGLTENKSLSPTSCPHPESAALSCRLHDGIRFSPSDQTPSCDGVTRMAGFSLIELAIVLVILGLLVGGIMSGQSLIRAAEMRSVSTQLGNYQAAVTTFRDKYFALPGDMRNATAFWGAVNATPATCRTTSSSTQATCDGDGNGQITSMDAGTTWSEYFHAWKHLANAGLVEGNYTGIKACTPVGCSQSGVNVPAGKMSNSGFSFGFLFPVTSTTDANWFVGPYGNFLFFGGNANADMSGQILEPEEMWNLDTKLDDGIPATGIMRTSKTVTNCHATSGTTYNLANTSPACFIMYMLQM